MAERMLPHSPMARSYLQKLLESIGLEAQPRKHARLIASFVQALAPPVTGAVHLTCADELEFDIAEVFRKGVAAGLTPRFGSVATAPFRLSTLGGHYQWGAMAVAEDHYALQASAGAYKLIVMKINSHVGVEHAPGGRFDFGFFQRRDRRTTCCGALSTMLDGGRGPFLDHLRSSFQWEGHDRIAALNDPDRVPPPERLLRAAVASARLQARMAAIDMQEHRPATPTLYLAPFAVTLNRQEETGELLCGVYAIDRRGEPADFYYGLDDHPENYRVVCREGRMEVTDDALAQPREARDHRQLVIEEWRQHRPKMHRDHRHTEAARGLEALINRHQHAEQAKSALKLMLPLLAELAPVPAALLLFGQGVASVHHVRQAHRLARGVAGNSEARAILDDVEAKIDRLSHEQAAAVASLLAMEYR